MHLDVLSHYPYPLPMPHPFPNQSTSYDPLPEAYVWAELGLFVELTYHSALPYLFRVLIITTSLARTKDGVRDLHSAGRQARGKAIANAAGTAGRLCLARIERAEN